MENLYKIIGEKIRELRQTYGGQGLSQEELAKKMGTTANTISRWETGTYKPSAVDLHKLAKFFTVSIAIFFPSDEATDIPVNALMSATGGLDEDDINELAEYARFRKARRALKSTGKESK